MIRRLNYKIGRLMGGGVPPPSGIINDDLSLSAAKGAQLIEKGHTQIAVAACNVFFEKGYHPTTIREIAQACNMSMGQLRRIASANPIPTLSIPTPAMPRGRSKPRSSPFLRWPILSGIRPRRAGPPASGMKKDMLSFRICRSFPRSCKSGEARPHSSRPPAGGMNGGLYIDGCNQLFRFNIAKPQPCAGDVEITEDDGVDSQRRCLFREYPRF